MCPKEVLPIAGHLSFPVIKGRSSKKLNEMLGIIREQNRSLRIVFCRNGSINHPNMTPLLFSDRS